MVRELETKVVFTTDESQKQKAIKAYESLQKAQGKVAKDALRTGKAYDEVAKELRVVDKEMRDLGKTLDAVDDKWRQNVDGAESLENQIKRLNDQFDETSRSVGAFGDIQSNIGAVRGLAGAAGLGEVDVGLGIVGEISALGEEIPKLKNAFSAAGPAIQVTAQAIGLSGITAQFASLGLGATAAALAAISLVILPLVILGAALAATFVVVSAESEKARKAMEAELDARRAIVEAIREGLTSDEAIAQLDELRRSRETEVQLLGEQQSQYDELISSFGAFADVQKLVNGEEEALASSIGQTTENITALDIEIEQLTITILDGELAANDAAVAEERLTEERETAVAEADRLVASIAQFETRRAQLIEQRVIREGDALETAALNQEFADEDQLAQERDHRGNLLKIATEGRENIEAISAELNALPAERLEAIADAENEGNAKLAELRGDFFKKSGDNLKKFQADTTKIETETSKKRIRLLEDVQDQLDDAARANDVIAFLRTQRESEKQIARGIIDEEAAEQERITRFIEGQQKEREAFLAKQADIQSAIAEERQAVNDSFTERREQLLETLELERAAIDEREAAEIARFDEQEAREEQQAERQRRRAELRDTQQERAFQRQLQQISEEQSLAEQAHARELARIREIDAAIQAIQPPPAAAPQQQRTAARGIGPAGLLGGLNQAVGTFTGATGRQSSSRRNRAFHDGGSIGFGAGQQEGFIFARSGEIVIDPSQVGSPIPFPNPSGSGKRATGGRGMTIIFSPTIETTVGDIASTADVNRAIEAQALDLGTKLVGMVERLEVP